MNNGSKVAKKGLKNKGNGKGNELGPKGGVKTSKSEVTATAATPAASPKEAPAAGYYLGDQKLEELVGGYCRASRDRTGRTFEILLEDAAALDKVIKDLDGGRPFEGLKRANNSDPYAVVAGHKDCHLCDKSLRRLHGFFEAVEAIRSLGEKPPELLGITAYVTAAPVQDLRKRLALLRRAEAEKMSVRDLAQAVEAALDEEDQGKAKAKRAQRKEQSLREEFLKFAHEATSRLCDFDKAHKAAGRRLGKQEVDALRSLRTRIDDLLGEEAT